MPIPVACRGCGKRFRAPDRGAGKKVPCPSCQAIIAIPLLESEDDVEYRLADELPAKAVAPSSRRVPETPQPVAHVGSAARRGIEGSTTARREAEPAANEGRPSEPIAWVPPTRSSTPNWLRHLHWCLALAMIPLAVSIIVPDRADVLAVADSELDATPSTASEETVGAASPSTAKSSKSAPIPSEDETQLLESLDGLEAEDLFALLPGRKLPGALLARDSLLHWLFAGLSAALYLTFLVFLATDKSARPWHLLGLGLLTATGGILLLLFVQIAAVVGVVRIGGAGAIVTLVLGLIGLSYREALDPECGLIASFLGFTFGVGLCEELCKALPILVYYRIGNRQSWRGAFLWGLASGTGFGVSEGVIYSQEFYNGVSGGGIYLVRFLSCVALHAIWTGSIGIAIHQRQDLLQDDVEEWWEYGIAVLRLIAIPTVLHGLYDTLLKRDLELLALATAGASFGYLAWQISHLRNSDDVDERAAFVSSYIRNRAAAGKA